MPRTHRPHTLRPYAVRPTPTPDDIAAVAAVLDEPDAVLLPVALGAEGDRVVAAARVGEPLEETSEPLALGVATTGSTGTPKIVLHTARSLRASIEATAEVTGGHGQWLLCLGINHIAGIQVVLRSAVAGIEPVTSSIGGPTFADDFAQAAGRLNASRRYVSMVPTQLQRLIASPRSLDALRGFDAILLGGAAADPGLLARARTDGVRVVTTYGMSETAGGCVYDGVPLPGVEIGTTDGVVTLTGDVVAAGYRDRVEPYPFAGRTFTTSDLGEVTDGRLRIIGRADDMINTGGKKVSPLRVEQALRTLESIDDAIVVGVPDAEWGSRTVALISGAGSAPEAVRDALRSKLAAHELPTRVIRVTTLPYKGIGKPDRAEALRMARERL
jgi:o-succinylbenzoate---CoA ligase